MGKYLKDKVRLAIKVLNEVDSYLDGQLQIENQSEEVIEVEYDKVNNSYILPDGLSEDEFFNLLDTKNNEIIKNDNLARKSSIKEEEIELPNLKEGTLRKRSDGRWEARYYDSDIQKSIYAKTQKECVSKLRKAIKDRDIGEKSIINNKKITLNEWINEWLSLYKSDLKKSTKTDYQSNLVKKVKSHSLGRMQVTKINSIDIEKFFKTIKHPATKARTFRQMKSCFTTSHKLKLIEYNPFDLVKSIAEPKSKAYVPKKKDLNEFLLYLKDAYFEIYLFAKFLSLTGLRKGEALALNWDDMKDQYISINKAWEPRANKIQTVKTKTSNRSVPLFPEINSLLIDIKLLSDGKEVFSFIFKQSVGLRFRHHRNKYGLRKLTLHSLRHYFATECLEAGIDRKVVQMWLGHSNYKTTSDTYSHINTNFEKSQIDIISKFRQNKD